VIIINKKIIIAIFIILILPVAIYGYGENTETQFEVPYNATYDNGYEFMVKLIYIYGNPVVNRTVEICLEKNNINFTVNTTTDGLGIASFTLGDMEYGNYTVYCNFPGDSSYKQSNITFNVTIIKTPENHSGIETTGKLGPNGINLGCA
jgi:hypothetical protein